MKTVEMSIRVFELSVEEYKSVASLSADVLNLKAAEVSVEAEAPEIVAVCAV